MIDLLTTPPGMGRYDPEGGVIVDMLSLVREYVNRDRSWAVQMRCTRFDESARRCSDYARRPKMCSRYPQYGEPDQGCRLCSYGTIDGAGIRWRPVAETGIFPHPDAP